MKCGLCANVPQYFCSSVFYCSMSADCEMRYCQDCMRKHRSDHWYGYQSFSFCNNPYTRMFRAGWLVVHPYWSVLYAALQDCDSTGCRIAAASYRPDVNAVADSYVMLGMYPQWESSRLIVCLFAAQMYFSWPMHDFVHQIGQCTTGIVNRSLFCTVGKRIFKRYASMRAVKGRLVSSELRGLMSTKNLSERRNGIVRYNMMLDDILGCIRICDAMAMYFKKKKVVPISEMLLILGQANAKVFDSRKTY